MSDIRWIKITTDMFEDEKIDFIASLPEADAIIVIWIRILALAGKCNAGGYVLLTENIPYTEEMLAHKFKKPLNVVKLALETFSRLEMLEMINNTLFLPNWEKHQNIEAMEKVKEYERIRKAKQRQNKKALSLPSSETSPGHVPDSPGNVTVIDIELDIDKEIINKREYAKKVFLTKKEYQKLIDKFGEDETEYWIQKLSQYKVKKQVEYDSDYHTALAWDRKEKRQSQSHLKLAPEQDKPKRTKAQLAADREIALNRWVEEGNNPREFVYEPVS